ncbi:MAG: GDP-L-fucose synthase [Actinomycetota bacterium]
MGSHRFDLSDARVHVAGHTGLVGSAVWRALEAAGVGELIGWRSSEVDLTDRDATMEAIVGAVPDVVVMAAARVGGILANASGPVEFLHDNLRIQANVFEAAHRVGVDRLLFLSSSCVYPRLAPQPLRPESLLTGHLEPTNDAYAIAKLAGTIGVQAYRRQYGRRWITAMPTNLYGPGDDFDLETSHVLPAMIRRFHEAARDGVEEVVLWGTGTPRREFLHVDDLARALVHLLRVHDDPTPINVGTGEDLTIAELATLVADVAGYGGRIAWDPSRPDGTPRKVLDVGPITALGWRPEVALTDGVRSTLEWYRGTVDRTGAPEGA